MPSKYLNIKKCLSGRDKKSQRGYKSHIKKVVELCFRLSLISRAMCFLTLKVLPSFMHKDRLPKRREKIGKIRKKEHIKN